MQRGNCVRIFARHFLGVSSIAISPLGDVCASSAGKIIKLWDIKTGKCIRTYEGHLKNVNSLAFSPDGLSLSSGSNDDSVRIWEVASTGKVDGNVSSGQLYLCIFILDVF